MGAKNSSAKAKKIKKIKRPSPKDEKIASASSQRYLIYIFILLIVILGIIAIYFKKILNKPIPGIGSLFISNSYAQTSNLSNKKEKIMTYETLELDDLLFKPELYLSGFKINPTLSLPPSSCIQMNLFSTKLAIVLSNKKSFSEEWKKYVEKCSFEFNKDLSAILDLKNHNFKSQMELIGGGKRLIIVAQLP